MNICCHHSYFEHYVLHAISCFVALRRLWKYGSFHTCRCYMLLNRKSRNALKQTSTDFIRGALWLASCFPGFGSFFIVIYYLEENVGNFPLESMPVGFITFLNFNDSTCSLAHPFYSNASISSKSQEERKL